MVEGGTEIKRHGHSTLQMLHLERLCTVRTKAPQAICLYQRSFIMSYGHHIECYNRFSGEYLQSFKGHTHIVRGLFVWKAYLFSSRLDGQLLQWRISTGQLVGRFHGQANVAQGFQVVADQFLYTIHDQNLVGT
jgi:hypothetical protein